MSWTLAFQPSKAFFWLPSFLFLMSELLCPWFLLAANSALLVSLPLCVLWRWPSFRTPAAAWVPGFPYPAGLSHYSVEPHSEFMGCALWQVRSKGMRDPRGQWPHLWPYLALFLWAPGFCIASVRTPYHHCGLQGSVLPQSGLVTATVPYHRAFAQAVPSTWIHSRLNTFLPG